MYPLHPFGRIADLRLAITNYVPDRKLRAKTPVIEQSQSATILLLKTEGPLFAKKGTRPCGVVFQDDSYLILFEEWSLADGSLVAYKYHYQRQDGFFLRYDMDKEKRRNIPRHHFQTSALEGSHLPCGGAPVDFGEVLEAIVGHFLP